MSYRAIIKGIDNDYDYINVNNTGNVIDFQGRTYFKDPEANFQVTDENGKVKGQVEAIYFEGIAAPYGSKRKETDITAQIFKEVHGVSFADPKISLLDKIFRRR